MTADIDSRRFLTALLFALFFSILFLLHLPLLNLPYFWDEAGYYVPAARDLLLTGSLIPHSTVSNAHPPLVMAYLALAWKLLGYSPVVTRIAMLALGAFLLIGVFRLAQGVANREVAIAATICTALYPVFFAQSSLAHLDLAAAAFTFWGLLAYIEERPWRTAVWYSLAALAKETAILAPLALLVWELIAKVFCGRARLQPCRGAGHEPEASAPGGLKLSLLFPILPLAFWYAYHWHRTGFVFGNPEFFRSNVQMTLDPLRILLALATRLWHVFGYLSLYLLILATIFAMWLPPLVDKEGERARISPSAQLSFLSLITAYVLAMSVIGSAVLARYMLPVVPLGIIICISTLRRRVQWWRAVVAIVAMAFVAGLFVNPPYGFSLEDNLAYRDYILLHENAEHFLEARYPTARVLTAWPASDELARPYLGYVTRPMRVFRIEDFTVEQLMVTADFHAKFDVALVFSTKYEPAHPWFERWRRWQQWKKQFFGYHRDVPPAIAAQILGGQLVYADRRKGQWVGVIEMEQVQEARRR